MRALALLALLALGGGLVPALAQTVTDGAAPPIPPAVQPVQPAPPAQPERIVAGLSQSRIAITANFDGSEILVYGAVRREAPAPDGRLDVVVTVKGPPEPVTVRRKARHLGIWVNDAQLPLAAAPSFYAVATTTPLAEILLPDEDARYRISIPRVLGQADPPPDLTRPEDFTAALIRLKRRDGSYVLAENSVALVGDTLLRADVALPASLSEGIFDVRIFLVRDGRVVDWLDTEIAVQKEGIERLLYRLSQDQPLIYGLLSLLLALVAGWGASAAFRLRRN